LNESLNNTTKKKKKDEKGDRAPFSFTGQNTHERGRGVVLAPSHRHPPTQERERAREREVSPVGSDGGGAGATRDTTTQSAERESRVQ